MSIADKLKQIKERCDAATPGPWSKINKGIEFEIHSDLSMFSLCCKRDAELIAHSRQDLPMLLEMVERQHRLLKFICVDDKVEPMPKVWKALNEELEKIAEKYKTKDEI